MGGTWAEVAMGTQRPLHRHSGQVASREPLPPGLGVKPHPSCPSLWQHQRRRTRWAVAEGSLGRDLPTSGHPTWFGEPSAAQGNCSQSAGPSAGVRDISVTQGKTTPPDHSHPGLGVPLYKLGRTLGFTEAPLPTR